MTKENAILVVDEDRETLVGRVALLRNAGYRVIGATSFEEARRALDEAPALLVTGVRLGAFNGLQLVILARGAERPIPAIVIAAFPDPLLRVEAGRLSAGYLDRSAGADRLLTLVADALGGPERHSHS